MTRIMDSALLRDKHGNEYSGKALMLALLMHTKGSRSRDAEKYVAKLLDDPNQS